ncbi:MAG: YgiQ family radical SAM protein [Elusimicrobiaceae bacterium]|nr:YgiQ family radical SAM protein [Elusimicrobiaceae bacterium]
MTLAFLPVTQEEIKQLGWDYVDVVLVSGDAYVDHPSFAAAVIGRNLEDLGLRVAILPQPRWAGPDDFRRFGRPRLFFGISAGNVDSMINHYTAAKKPRSDDQYSPGGQAGLRPDRASIVYSQLARQAYPGVPVVLGGVEASLRRAAHYDFWSDTVKRSILLDSKADILVYGMGEYPVREIAMRLNAGQDVKTIRDLRGTAFALGANEAPDLATAAALPSFESVKTDFKAFNLATKLILENTNPLSAQPLVQYHDKRAVVINPPALPLTEAEMDATYSLPYSRAPHPVYRAPVPAFEMIRDSVTIHRGCFGGCGFCSLTLHQGRIIQTRSEKSIIAELKLLAARPGFHGIISDLGAPTANMYGLNCKNPAARKRCRRTSCLYPGVCPNLDTSHTKLFHLLDEAAKINGIKKILINSGIRMDLAILNPEYIKRLACRHTGGQLSVAPEHICPDVLRYMQKPPVETWEQFDRIFSEASSAAGKDQFLVPYFIAAHPGCGLSGMIDLALYLKRNGYHPRQVNDFIPSPMDYATAIYHTGMDPFTSREVFVEKTERGKKLQRALLQFFKPENKPLVIQALRLAKRMNDASELISAAPGQKFLLRKQQERKQEKAVRDGTARPHDNSCRGNAGHNRPRNCSPTARPDRRGGQRCARATRYDATRRAPAAAPDARQSGPRRSPPAGHSGRAAHDKPFSGGKGDRRGSKNPSAQPARHPDDTAREPKKSMRELIRESDSRPGKTKRRNEQDERAAPGKHRPFDKFRK